LWEVGDVANEDAKIVVHGPTRGCQTPSTA
jgi:hypothetical protein